MDMKSTLAAVDKDYIITLRRELHRYPELSFELPMTLALVRRELTALGVPFTERYGKSSIAAYINPDCEGFSIGIRADMDALPLNEKTGLPYRSEHPGVMHACGHDAHTAMLLGTAKALKSVEKQLACKVVLVFQASEEPEDSGAQAMVQDGLMDEIDVIIAMHVENWLPSGAIGVSPGPSMAASQPITIEFFGKTAHATLPQTGVNALAMAVSAYTGIQNMLVTRLSPSAEYVCSVGMLQSGVTDNVIPDYAHMKLSLRTYEPEQEAFIIERIQSISENAAAAQGGTMRLTTETKAPPVINDPAVAARVLAAAKSVVGEENVFPMPKKLSSEDFSFYLEKKPGALFRLGTRNESKGCTTLPHNNDFMLDEDALDVGSRVCVQFVLDNMTGFPT